MPVTLAQDHSNLLPWKEKRKTKKQKELLVLFVLRLVEQKMTISGEYGDIHRKGFAGLGRQTYRKIVASLTSQKCILLAIKIRRKNHMHFFSLKQKNFVVFSLSFSVTCLLNCEKARKCKFYQNTMYTSATPCMQPHKIPLLCHGFLV